MSNLLVAGMIGVALAGGAAFSSIGFAQPAAAPATARTPATSSSVVTAQAHDADPRVTVDSPHRSVQRGPTDAVRNVILVIGDGMGPQEIGLLTLYARLAKRSIYADRTAAMEKLYDAGVVGLVNVHPAGMLVVDSAAAATQLGSGQMAGSEMIGVDAEGNPTDNLVEAAQRAGKSTGLVSDTRITHATPAGFAAHQPHRSLENEIAVDLLEHRIDVLLSGGLRHWLPQAANDPSSPAHAAVLQMTGGQFPFTSRRSDNRNLLLEARGDYRLVFDRTALAKVSSGKVLGLFADSEMDDALLEREKLADDATRTQPTLVEMTEKTLELLNQNPRGFFVMIEGGQIDWAGHNNDAGTMLHELLRIDATIAAIMRWMEGRDDTLLVVTADHETGGFGFSYAGRPLPPPTRLGGRAFASQPYKPNFNYAPAELLDGLYDQRKSFFTLLFGEFDNLPPEQRTAERLMELVNDASAFKIDLDDAVEVLTRIRNPNFEPGHPYLGTPTTPLIRDFEAFYVYGENLRMNALARKLADKQHVVWGAGTHTSTPVPVVAYGAARAARRFSGLMHATDVGRLLKESLTGPASLPVVGAASALPSRNP